MEHQLENGYVAKRVGKGFEIFKNGEFKFYTARLKFAKDYAKMNK